MTIVYRCGSIYGRDIVVNVHTHPELISPGIFARPPQVAYFFPRDQLPHIIRTSMFPSATITSLWYFLL
jgi:hypothetical protein